MKKENFKKLSRILVLALIVAVALVSYNINFPAGRSSSQNWKFAYTHPTILLHILVATFILVQGVILLVKSIRARNRTWIIISAVGLVFVLLAFVTGERYVTALQKSTIDAMGNAWLGAIVTYGIGWYLGHKKDQPHQDSPESSG